MRRALLVAALSEGVGHPILSLFADGTDGFWFDGTNLYQTTGGATAAASASDPVGLALDQHASDGRGVVNRYLWSQQFDQAGWTKLTASIVADAAVAPDGTMTADKFVGTVGSSNIRVNQLLDMSAGTTYVYQIKANAAEYSNLRVTRANTLLDSITHDYDLDLGTASGGGTITDLGDGWYLLSGTVNCNSSGSSGVTYTAEPGATGDGTSGLFLWAAQLEAGMVPSAYQRTGSALGGPGNHGTQTTSAARPTFQTGPLMRFDGTDDALDPLLLPGTAMTLMAKFKCNAVGDVVLGCQQPGVNLRCYIGLNSTGKFSAGIGSETFEVIAGGSSVVGVTGVGAVTCDGSNVKLYWNGAEIYSAAQSGSAACPLSLYLGGVQSNTAGTLAAALAGDIYHAVSLKKALTHAQIAAASTWLTAN